jgi:hypothetical protein
MNRSQRRAAERFARTQAQKTAAVSPAPETTVPAAEPTPERPISNAQLAANRANAQLSTGPTSAPGKARSSVNAVKTALTGRTVLIATDDAAEYQRFILSLEKELKPVGAQECELVQSIGDTFWRLRRILELDHALYAAAASRAKEMFADLEPAERAARIQLHIHETNAKELKNLYIQEARLIRRRERETAELRRLQQERIQIEAHNKKLAAQLYVAAQQNGETFNPAEFGFDFSIEEIERYLVRTAAMQPPKKAAGAGGHR